MKRNICKKCGSKTICTKMELVGLNVKFWLCDFCSSYRKNDFLPLKLQSIIN